LKLNHFIVILILIVIILFSGIACQGTCTEEPTVTETVEEPTQILYALDGREQAFKQSEVEAQLTVGWYLTKQEVMGINAWNAVNFDDAITIARTMYGEARGLTDREIAMVGWCILNRVDAGYGTVYQVCTAKGQFTGYGKAMDDRCYQLACDVLWRWNLERMYPDYGLVGRVLPKDYLWFTGDGKHNYFRNSFNGPKCLTSLYHDDNPY
jgi:hypothetical protein